MTLVANFGHDPNLLTASDAFLKHRQNVLSSKIEMLAEELNGIMTARRIKMVMADKNMVAMKCPDMVKLLPLKEAVHELAHSDAASAEQQLLTWMADGFDVGQVMPEESDENAS